jgi:acetyl/propionyl-CoA carboxylase alpha subunit
LPFAQTDIASRGHAIECRIYAEHSATLLPQSGRLLRYREPAGRGVRVDSGVREGQQITVHYDPLLAKLITYGSTREDALARMRQALLDYDILGIHHNIPFLLRLLGRPDVQDAQTYTRFIEDHLDELAKPPDESLWASAAALGAFTATRSTALAHAARSVPARSRDPWATLGPVEW